MADSHYPRLATEGIPFIAAALIAGGAALHSAGTWTLGPTLSVVVLLVALFRDPRRDVPAEPLGVLAPSDGTVREITPVESGVIKRRAIRIVLSVNNLGAYTARSPIEGKVLDPRDNLSEVSRALGVSGMWVRSDEGDDVVILFHGPRFVGSPRAFVRYGERVGQGQRFGYLRLARRAEIYVPSNARVRVAPGDRVRAGIDVLAELRRR